MAVESFAVFAHFAVNQIMKPSPRPSSRSPAAPPRLHSTPLLVWWLAGALVVPCV